MTEAATKEWVPYPEGSAVQAANQMVAGLKKAGRQDLILLSQGFEETEPEGTLGDFREVTVKFSSGYQKDVGGAPAQRQVMANFLNDFLGYNVANSSNTFIFFQNGRAGLDHIFRRAAQEYQGKQVQPVALIGDLSWPMIEDLVKDSDMSAFGYKLVPGNLEYSVQFARSVGRLGYPCLEGQRALALLYTNYPNNPTGQYGTKDEVSAVRYVLDETNKRRGCCPKVQMLNDNPYYGGLPQKTTGSILCSPYENVAEENGQTPVVFVTSFAKSLGLATPGVHAVTFSQTKMAKEFETWAKSKAGFSYFPEAMEAVTGMVGRDQYPALKAHFAAMAAKYQVNNDILTEALGDQVMPGDPGMVRTVIVPSGALNKRIEIPGGVLITRSGREVAEYIANKYGVIVVDQSMPTHGALIRVALKAEDRKIIEAGVRDIVRAFGELEAA